MISISKAIKKAKRYGDISQIAESDELYLISFGEKDCDDDNYIFMSKKNGKELNLNILDDDIDLDCFVELDIEV